MEMQAVVGIFCLGKNQIELLVLETQSKGGFFPPLLEELQMAGEVSLLGALPVDGVIQLLHLLLCQDAIGEVRLELLQRQLPVICQEKKS